MAAEPTLFDEASLALIASGGAGKDGKVYSIKPVPEYGPELVTNGGFDTDSDWTKGNGWSITNGQAVHTGSGDYIEQGSLTTGKKYKVVVDVIEATTSAFPQIYMGGLTTAMTSPKRYVFIITAVSNDKIKFRGLNSCKIDNVSVQEVIKADGDFTFSRGSNLSATRVGADGLIEKGRENLLTRSNQFDGWNLDNVTSGHAGYDGTNNAWLQSGTSRLQRNISLGASVYTGSIYVKAGFSNYVQLYIVGSTNALARFELIDNGTIVNSGGISPKIEPVSGATGWYRISTNLNGNITTFRIYPQNDSSGTQTADSSVYIQDAQLEIGLAATDYIESGESTGKAGLLEDEPRFDYSGGATCPSLLLEPSRSQLIPYSEYLGGWTSGTFTPLISSVTSPEGVNNAYTLPFTNSAGSNIYTFATLSSTNEHIFSIYAKVGSGTKTFRVRAEYGGTSVTSSDFTATSTWQRFEFAFTPTATNIVAYIFNGSNGEDSDLEVYGIQVEAGSYPTSYIPNHSSGSVTRGADTCSKTNASSLIGQTEGTIFAEFTPSSDVNTEVFQLLATTSIQNVVTIGCGAGKIYGVVITNSSYVANFDISQTIPNNTFKVALCYKNNDITFFINGQKVASNTNAYSGPADFTKILFNDPFLFGKQSVSYKKTLIFKSKLSDTECIKLTTI